MRVRFRGLWKREMRRERYRRKGESSKSGSQVVIVCVLVFSYFHWNLHWLFHGKEKNCFVNHLYLKLLGFSSEATFLFYQDLSFLTRLFSWFLQILLPRFGSQSCGLIASWILWSSVLWRALSREPQPLNSCRYRDTTSIHSHIDYRGSKPPPWD